MGRTYTQARKKVLSRVGQGALNKMEAYIKKKRPGLWGLVQRPGFLVRMLIWTLYRYLKGKAFNDLWQKVRTEDRVTKKSVEHNVKVIRSALAEWGKTTITAGSLKQRKKAAKNVPPPSGLEDVDLWIDSTDIQVKGGKEYSKKGPRHSFKLNKPGRRYMILMDGETRIRKIWGGYSPKVHDGEFLEICSGEIEFAGSGIIGDEHFSRGKKLCKNVTFFTTQRKLRKPKSKKNLKSWEKLSKRRTEENKKISKLRARIEAPFGEIKSKWQCLSQPWLEEDEELDELIRVAAGVHNANI